MSTSLSTGGGDATILLDAGTNELEILVLMVGGGLYGVNVAKVREVLEINRITTLPQCHPSVEGTVQIRGDVVELVHLSHYLDDGVNASQRTSADKMLVLEFNNALIAFRVDSVETIVRTSWSDVRPMPTLDSLRSPVTSTVLMGDRLVLMLDFEAIGAGVGLGRTEANERQQIIKAHRSLENLPIVFAEDSRMIREMLKDALSESGFTNVRGFIDGQSAWDFLVEAAAESNGAGVEEKVAAVVSDIEMPRMDGLSLTKRIRENDNLKDLPVILFSSLVSKGNEKKGSQVGASCQITKPHYDELVEKLHHLLQRPPATA